MKEIIFATTNKGKVASLQQCFDALGAEVMIAQIELDIAEEQADDALQVAQAKARRAFAELAKPLVVDDSAFHILALGGFPGVYQKYIVETIGPEGIIKLMEGAKDRSAYFISNLVYAAEDGATYCFSDSQYEGTITTAFDPALKNGWGALSAIFIPKGGESVLGAQSPDETRLLQKATGFHNAYEEFASWYKEQYD